MPADEGLMACAELAFDPAGNEEGGEGEEEADADFAQGCDFDVSACLGVEDEGEDGDEEEDEKGVHGLELGGVDFPAEYGAVHLLCLLDPGGGGLIKDGPEDGDEEIKGDEASECAHEAAVGEFSPEAFGLGGDVGELMTP